MPFAESGEKDRVVFDRNGEIGTQEMVLAEPILEREEIDVVGLVPVFDADSIDFVGRLIEEDFDRF